jgi:hypothetical protein
MAAGSTPPLVHVEHAHHMDLEPKWQHTPRITKRANVRNAQKKYGHSPTHTYSHTNNQLLGTGWRQAQPQNAQQINPFGLTMHYCLQIHTHSPQTAVSTSPNMNALATATRHGCKCRTINSCKTEAHSHSTLHQHYKKVKCEPSWSGNRWSAHGRPGIRPVCADAK